MRWAPKGNLSLKAAAVVLGALASVVLVLSAFFRFNLRAPGPLLIPRFSLGDFLGQVPGHLRWLMPFILLSASVIPLRALQWQRTLDEPVPFRERYHLVAIGAFVHNVVPGKLGDLTRAFLLARTRRLPFLHVLGSVVVCKLLEFAALMLLVAMLLAGPFGETLAPFTSGLKAAALACLGLFALVVFLAHYARPFAAALERKERLPRVQRSLQHLAAGLGTARSFRGMGVALLYSVGPVLAPALGYGLGLQAIGVRGGVFGGPVMLGAIALGQLTPGIPAGTGIYYFVTSWVARSLGAAPEAAAAYALLTHLATISTQVVVGGLSVWLRRLRVRDLRQRADMAAHAIRESVEKPGAAQA